MRMNKELPKRKPIRLKSFDYNSAGAYFITVCTENREKILSHIVGGDVPDAPKKHGGSKPPPYEAAPRFHSASPRAFPSCHPERSEAKSNCKAASNKVQTGSPTEKFDKLRMTRSGKKQHPRMSAVLYRNNPKWVIISWSFSNTV